MHEMHKADNSEPPHIFGIRPLIEAIRSGKLLDRIFIQKGLQGENAKELIVLLRAHQLPYQSVPIEKLNRLTRKNHQGVFAFLTEVEYQPFDEVLTHVYETGETPLVMLLDRVTDVRNFGAIARSAECFGVHALIVPGKGSAPASPDAVKTSAGALLRLPVCREDNLKKTLLFLKDSGVKLIACTEKGAESLYSTDLSGPVCLIMGSEEDGISAEYLKLCDQRSFIPMHGQTASLNVSVAAGIFLNEVNRQRLNTSLVNLPRE